jgi:hypothetical protein
MSLLNEGFYHGLNGLSGDLLPALDRHLRWCHGKSLKRVLHVNRRWLSWPGQDTSPENKVNSTNMPSRWNRQGRERQHITFR